MVKEEENSVYVGGLPWETRACELEAAFRSLGSILEAKVMVEQNGRSLGFGYVTFADRSEAYDAIKQMNGKMLGRRCVSVQKARPKYDEPSYALFSCRGPYGEGDDSVGDFCFSCKGLDEGCSVYVGNLPWKTDACELEAAFSQFGSILQTKVMVEQNGRSCGFGYVTFADRSEAYDAINEMDCEGIGGRCVSVKMARPEFDEPSYASFSCRGPYGEVDDDSEGDVCISCKGLYKLHEETSIGCGGSESSYALSSEVDVEEEEVPDKLSDRSGSSAGNNNRQMEVDGENLEDFPKKLSDSTTANGNYNSDQSEVEGEDVEEMPEKLSDNSSATTTTTNGNNNNDQSEVDEEDLEEIPEKLSDRTATAAANTNTNTNTNTNININTNTSKQSEVDGDGLEEITEKLSDSTIAATTTTTYGNKKNDQSEVDGEGLEEISEKLSDSSTTSATSGNNNSNKLTELDGEDLEEITEKFSDSTTAATATNGNNNNDQSEVNEEDLKEIPEKLSDGTTTATAAATNGNNNNKLSEVDGEILEEIPEKLCDSTATITTKGNNKSQSDVNEEDLEEIHEKLSDNTTTATTTTTKGNKNKQSKVDGEDLEEISEKLSDSTTAAAATTASNNKQPESDGEDLKEITEKLGSSTAAATTANKKQPEVDGEDLEEIGGKLSDITIAAAAATATAATTTTTTTTYGNNTKQSEVDGEDFEVIPVKLCDKTTTSAATITTSKQREVDGEDLEEIHEKLIDITTADATTTTPDGNNTKQSQVEGGDFEEIPEKLCDSTTAAATSNSNNNKQPSVGDSKSSNSVESKILPDDPEHLYSVLSTLRQRGPYAGGAGRVGEDNCLICGCPLHWACNCSSIGASLLDKDNDPSNAVCQNDDSDSASLPSSFEEKEAVLDPVSLFEGVVDCSELAKIFKLKPSTFLKVPQELTPRFRRLVLNEFSLFLSDIGKIDLQNLDRETLRNLLLTLKDFKNNKLELDWLEQRLQAKHAVSEVNRANACLKELEAELVAIERRAKEIKVEKNNLKTMIDQHSEYLLKHSSNVNGDVSQDLF